MKLEISQVMISTVLTHDESNQYIYFLNILGFFVIIF